jgi:hypothetical protein
VAHVAHDELLVAAWVSGDTEPEDAARAADLTARCDVCRELATDLRGLRSAIRALPPPTRTRDFRLTPADAERVRSRPGWLGRLRSIRGATFTRPLAGAMTALGLAGLLLTTVPLGGAGVGGEDPDTARIEAVGASSPGRQEAPSAAASVAAAPAEAAGEGAASERPMPAAATDRFEFLGTPAPGDATSSGAAGAAGGDDGDLHETPPAVAQAATAPPSIAQDVAARSAGEPTPPGAVDRTRPALAVASAALLLGGLLLFFVTRRRGARSR